MWAWDRLSHSRQVLLALADSARLSWILRHLTTNFGRAKLSPLPSDGTQESVTAVWQYFSLIRRGERGLLTNCQARRQMEISKSGIFNYIHAHCSFLRDVFRWESGPSLAIHRRTGYGVQSGSLHRQERRLCKTKSPKGGIKPR